MAKTATKKTKATTRTKGRWFVYEPEWADGYTHVENLIIGKEHKNDVTQEIAYVNCDSFYFDSKVEKLPIPSAFRDDATVHPEAIANAKFIVKACNNHDALVETAAALLQEIAKIRFSEWPDDARKMMNINPDHMDTLIRSAASVLRKAGKRTCV